MILQDGGQSDRGIRAIGNTAMKLFCRDRKMRILGNMIRFVIDIIMSHSKFNAMQ